MSNGFKLVVPFISNRTRRLTLAAEMHFIVSFALSMRELDRSNQSTAVEMLSSFDR